MWSGHIPTPPRLSKERNSHRFPRTESVSIVQWRGRGNIHQDPVRGRLVSFRNDSVDPFCVQEKTTLTCTLLYIDQTDPVGTPDKERSLTSIVSPFVSVLNLSL